MPVMCATDHSDRSNLLAHQRIHSGGSPYASDVCKKSFSIEKSDDIITEWFLTPVRGVIWWHMNTYIVRSIHMPVMCVPKHSDRGVMWWHINAYTVESVHMPVMCVTNHSVRSNLITHLEWMTCYTSQRSNLLCLPLCIKTDLSLNIRDMRKGGRQQYVTLSVACREVEHCGLLNCRGLPTGTWKGGCFRLKSEGRMAFGWNLALPRSSVLRNSCSRPCN
jgi:hypothetical protein